MKRGNREALPKLIPLVYYELKRLAAHFLHAEREGHTLQPTALVNEAYLRLAGQTAPWHNRAQFMGVAAQLMRRILVDYARQRVAAKRGGGEMPAEIEVCEISGGGGQSEELLAVDEALIAYLSTRIERSFAGARAAVEDLDREALRLKRPVTRALAAELLGQQ